MRGGEKHVHIPLCDGPRSVDVTAESTPQCSVRLGTCLFLPGEGPKNSLGSPCCRLCLARGRCFGHRGEAGLGELVLSAAPSWCWSGPADPGDGMHRLQGMAGGFVHTLCSYCFLPSRVFCKSDAIPPWSTHTHESACWPLPGETWFFQADWHEGRMKSAPCPAEGQ